MKSGIRQTFYKWAALFGVCTFIGLINFSTFQSEILMEGKKTPFIYPLILELTGAYSVFIILPFWLWVIERFTIRKTNWFYTLPLHLLTTAVGGFIHTFLMTISRVWIFSRFGLGTYDFGDPIFRFVMEFHKQFLIYWLIYLSVQFYRIFRQNRERERQTTELKIKTAQLNAQLSEAKLQTLKAQIHPHFLFNTMNMISSIMYKDVAKADTMMSALSRLLRITMETSDAQKITAAKETEFIRLYAELMQARFGQRLVIQINEESGSMEALVPSLLLQPLVENAIKHNDWENKNIVTVDISVKKVFSDLNIQISDNGNGIPDDAENIMQNGIGLRNTKHRLEQLYRERHRFDLQNIPGGGLSVTITIPFETQESNS